MRRQDAIELTIVYEQLEGDRVQATIPALPGTITVGRTRTEARRNACDALRSMLSAPPEFDRAGRDVEALELRFTPPGRLRDVGRGR